MPAPTSIRIRYGDAGLLGRSVAQAASAQAQADQANRGAALDAQLIGQMLDHTNRLQEQQFASDLDANRLQAAYALRRSVSQPEPTSGEYYAGVGVGGGADASAALKNAMLDNSPVSDTAKLNLKALVGRRDVTPDQLRSVIFEAEKTEKNSQADAEKSQSRDQKTKYVQAASKGMNEQDAATLAAMVDDDKVSLAQIRTAADAIRQRNTVLPRTALALNSAALDRQQQQIKGQMDSITRGLAKLGINPEATDPASFNPTFRDPSKGVEGFGARINDKVNPFSHGNLVTPNPNQEAFQAYVAYHKLKRQFNDLAAQRQALLTQSANPSATPQANDLANLSDAELLARLNQ